jgi:putative ABC transport system permease protein
LKKKISLRILLLSRRPICSSTRSLCLLPASKRRFYGTGKLATRFRWKLGDIITLKGTIYPGNWEFVVRAIYHGKDERTDESQFLFHWDYLNETLKKTAPPRADQIGIYMVGVTHPSQSAEVAARIDTTFKNSLAETLTETEKAFQLSFVSMSEAIILAIKVVSFVVIIIILAVVANTMAMTMRERMSEYAVFKTLGFKGGRIAGLIVGESLVITMLGAGLGIALTFPVAAVFKKILGAYFPIFNVAPDTVGLAIVCSVAVALLAAIVPTWRAVTMRIADGLRRIG